MIGVTSGPDNMARAIEHGYADANDRNSKDIAARVRELTDDRGVSVVFDSIGKATFDASIDSLAPRGFFISFGATTGGQAKSSAAQGFAVFLSPVAGQLGFRTGRPGPFGGGGV